MPSSTPGFWIDAAVIALYFFAIVTIGLLASRGNTTLKEFALGGRSIPWWAVLASIVAAETSAATFLGTPAEGYKTHAFFYGQLAIGTVIARVVIAFTFIGPYYKYGVESIYEFLMVRFGPRTKNAASGIFLFTRVLGIGVRLYLGGVILVVLWRHLFPGAPVTLGNYFWGILFVTLVTTAYTIAGGIKAVVWTDLIQASLMLGSVAFVLWYLIHHLGGVAATGHAMGGWDQLRWIQVGWDSSLPFGKALAAMLTDPYTIPDDGHPWHRSGHGSADAHRTGSTAFPTFADPQRFGGHPYCRRFPRGRNPALPLLQGTRGWCSRYSGQ